MMDTDATGPIVFISYVHSEALEYATEAKNVFGECGYRAWVWHFDHAASGRAKAEMQRNVEACDYFLDICTAGSRRSRGQALERDEAARLDRPVIIMAFDKRFISDIWGGDDPLIYNYVTPQTFAPRCRKVARELLGKDAHEEAEGALIEPA
jgi:TIR domain